MTHTFDTFRPHVFDEAPSTDANRRGPSLPATHERAVGAVRPPEETVDGFVKEFLEQLNFGQGVKLSQSTINDQYLSLARTIRSYLMAGWLETGHRRRKNPTKMVGYLSAEYLLGRQLGNSLLATGLIDLAEQAMQQCGIDIADYTIDGSPISHLTFDQIGAMRPSQVLTI